MNITRHWEMPNSNTFSIRCIERFIKSNIPDGLVIDPFANTNRIAGITNDINPDMRCDYTMDALDFLKIFSDLSVDGVLFDPPYSPRQVTECYTKMGRTVDFKTTSAAFWSNMKKEISRIVKPGGKVFTFSWNSGGVGKTFGFELTDILLVAHGGWHNDTICTLEVKQNTLL
jgi:hypothetical protein